MSIGLGGISSLYVFSVIFTYWLLTRGFLTPKTSLNKATLWGNVQIGIIKKNMYNISAWWNGAAVKIQQQQSPCSLNKFKHIYVFI